MATVLYGRLSDLPAFNPDVDETVPEAVTDLRGQLATAEHVEELTALAGLLSRLELRVFDAVTAEVATSLAATHRLPAADAVHLATAVVAGADRFVTNNLRDVPDTLTDIDVTYPDMLSDRLPYVTRQNPVSQCGKPFPVQRR